MRGSLFAVCAVVASVRAGAYALGADVQHSSAAVIPQKSDSIITRFSDPSTERAPDDQIRPFIYNGTAPSGKDPVPDAVMITAADGTYCTGVLISPTAIVTAGHCVCGSPMVQASFGLTYSSASVMPLDSSRATGLFDCAGPKNHDPTGAEHDIGVVFLKSRATVTPRKIATSSEIDAASDLEIFGYGRDEAHAAAQEGVKRRAVAPVSADHSCGEAPGVDPAFSAHCQQDWEIILGTTTTDVGICSGDSGGPAYVEISEMEPPIRYVAAIASRFVSPCGRGSVYVRLDGPALTWLRSKVSDL